MCPVDSSLRSVKYSLYHHSASLPSLCCHPIQWQSEHPIRGHDIWRGWQRSPCWVKKGEGSPVGLGRSSTGLWGWRTAGTGQQEPHSLLRVAAVPRSLPEAEAAISRSRAEGREIVGGEGQLSSWCQKGQLLVWPWQHPAHCTAWQSHRQRWWQLVINTSTCPGSLGGNGDHWCQPQYQLWYQHQHQLWY